MSGGSAGEVTKAEVGAALLRCVLTPTAADVEETVPGLSEWLLSLKLGHCESGARDWCQRQGYTNLEQVVPQWQLLADALCLRPLERHRLAKAAQAPPVTRFQEQPVTFGPEEDTTRYRLLESIGAGATSRVSRCVDSSGNVFAVKRIGLSRLRRQGNFRQIEERLHQEIAIHLSLQHPRIVGLVDVVETEEELCLVLEHLGGGSLDHIIVRGPLREEQASDVFRQIAEGLQHMHSRGFAHGDLKPANILLSDAQHLQVKLADFGHSKVVNDVLTADIVGTPLYMAPELFARQAFDARAADLWSLGVILYELLTMHCPFAGTGAELTEAIQKCEISFWVDDDIPVPSSSAQSLVKALLRRQPSRRPTLEWCLIHSFVSGPGTVGRLLLRDGLRATEVSEAEDAMLQERYLLPQLTEMHIRELRNDLRKWMLLLRAIARDDLNIRVLSVRRSKQFWNRSPIAHNLG
ncbi:unnamed protein product [Symbiodinium natans]|uniref:Protein kinase domain-containing protein n=1 Tax=Symbiodinium natans TaxID=878477 RepID=A0A812PM23_9DINO|nr:unnamed protein product [Symbiodinium natans]